MSDSSQGSVKALRDPLQDALESTFTHGRELGDGGMSRVFVAEEVHFCRQGPNRCRDNGRRAGSDLATPIAARITRRRREPCSPRARARD